MDKTARKGGLIAFLERRSIVAGGCTHICAIASPAVKESPMSGECSIQRPVPGHAWARFPMDGTSKDDLLADITRDVNLSLLARKLAERVEFGVFDAPEGIETIVLTSNCFGDEHHQTSQYLFSSPRLMRWSWENVNQLPEDRIVDLLPAEAAFRIRRAYVCQARGEALLVPTGMGYVFTVGRDSGNGKYMKAESIKPGDHWSPRYPIAYQLRRPLPDECRKRGFAPPPVSASEPEDASQDHSLNLLNKDGNLLTLAQVERAVLLHALRQCGGRITTVAQRLGIGRSTLYRRLNEAGISAD